MTFMFQNNIVWGFSRTSCLSALGSQARTVLFSASSVVFGIFTSGTLADIGLTP